MAVVKEFMCLAHGDFDGYSLDDGSPPSCPQGCGTSMVQRVYRTPPTIQSAGYRSINRSFEALAKDHGLSNMNNRSAAQDGISMRRATPETYRRLNEATDLIMHASRSGQKGADASQFFRPLNQFAPGSTGDGGVLHRDGDQVSAAGIPLNAPRPELVAAPFDGAGLGVPASDA